MEKEIRDCQFCGQRVNISSPNEGGQGLDEKGYYHLNCIPKDGICDICGRLEQNAQPAERGYTE